MVPKGSGKNQKGMSRPDSSEIRLCSSHSSEKTVISQKASTPKIAAQRKWMMKLSAQKPTNMKPCNRLAGGCMP
ncbi:hypothetical protein D3C87_1943230 [compost metagenome]